MKLHINIEQISELDCSWREFLSKNNLFSQNEIDKGVSDLQIANTLTIGKMIELIDSLVESIEILHFNIWLIKYQTNNGQCYISTNDELCDVLWGIIVDIVN